MNLHNLNESNFKHFDLSVIKFGSSILSSPEKIPGVVHEIYRYLRNGQRILVVVSALGNTTDDLLALAKNVVDDAFAEPHSNALATLLATGEAAASALLTIALDRAGIPAINLDHKVLKTHGSQLNAEPYNLATDYIQQLFKTYPVIVIPGFVGCDEENKITLLGRGGSDFTALFAAWSLQAKDCILYKDVDGIFDDDPNVSEKKVHRYKIISYQDCLNRAYPVIQHKALLFAQEKKIEFQVKALASIGGTYVGAAKSHFADSHTIKRPLRIALLGLGTVGLGVFKRLICAKDSFEVVGIAVKEPFKHLSDGAPLSLISNDPWEIISRDCDIVVELMGGIDPAEELIAAALRNDRDVVTANKALIAAKGDHLFQLAQKHNQQLRYSAAVAGALPVLETLERIRSVKTTHHIKTISGILNGTCNFVLEKISQGVKFSDAVKAAQQAGFAEADPSLDLSGQDAAQKLILICRAAFATDPTHIEIEGIENFNEQLIFQASEQEKVIRLVAICEQTNQGISASVKPIALPADHPLAKVQNADNCVLIQTTNGESIQLNGKGAGRWPTAESVYADLIDLSDIHRSKSEIECIDNELLQEVCA